MQTHQYDVVIVGAGGAGMRAALESGQRVRTAVLTKLYPTRSHTGAAQGGMCAALANVEEDNWEWHTFDTVKGGDYLVDQDAAEVMAKEAIDAVLDLEKMGLPFNRTPEGRIDQRRFGGHTRNHGEAAVRRSCYAADRTGHMILQTLYQQCVKHDVEFFNEFYVLDLLLNDRPDGGRSAPPASSPTSWPPARSTSSRPSRSSSPPAASARSSRPPPTRTPSPATAWASSYRRGLPLEDMEFFQFHPTGLAGLGILLSEAARGEGGILRNTEGERFMERYAPTIKDLAPRDIVARAMANEVREGRGAGPEQGLRAARPDAPASRRTSTRSCPDITEFARTYLGVEPYTEPVPVYPTAHYAMGGVPTNIEAEVLRDNTDVVPRPVRRRRGRLRVACTAPTGWAPTRCSTSTCSAGAPASRPRSTPRPRRASSCPRTPRAAVVAVLEEIRDAARRRARRGHPQGAAGDDGPQRAGLPHRGVAEAGAGRHRGAAGAVPPTSSVQDKGKRFNTDLLEAVELGFLLDLAEVARRRRAGPQRVARRALPRGLPGPRRRELHAAHDGLPRAVADADGRRRRRSGSTTSPSSMTRYQPMERKY